MFSLWKAALKKIILLLDDDVFAELKSHLMARGLTGSMYGVVDEFAVKLIEAIEKGLVEKHFFFEDPHKGPK